MEIFVVGLLVAAFFLMVLHFFGRAGTKSKIDVRLEKTEAVSEAQTRKRIETLPEALVSFVKDGDTVDVVFKLKTFTIRLDSIDCPEDGQRWGNFAAYGLIKLIGGKSVRLEVHGQDPYGRTIATVYVRNSETNDWTNVNERMVTLGHAWVMRKFWGHLPQDRKDKLNRLENWARAKKVGLWQDADPVPPWRWRNGNKPPMDSA